MRRSDLIFVFVFAIILCVFLPFPFLVEFQKNFLYNEGYWLLTSFLKFAVLASFGEAIGLRIKTGKYTAPSFGLIPRAVVWGFLGITIKLAFVLFAAGVPAFLEKSCGIKGIVDAMKMKDIFEAMDKGAGGLRLLAAFSISALMNIIYAPVMMTFHKITDTHISDHKGKFSSLFSPIKFSKIFPRIDWFVQWDFVFKRTIPLFWIPAQTITFLLANEYRVAFAAFLSIALGILLSLAAMKGKK